MTNKNTVSDGDRLSVGRSSILGSIQPHNYKIYFDYKKDSERTYDPMGSVNGRSQVGIGSVGRFVYSTSNNGHQHNYVNYNECTIQVHKHQISVQSKRDHKQWYRVNLEVPEESEYTNQQLEKDLLKHSKETLKIFIDQFGGSSNYNVLKIMGEIKVKGDEFIDSIPDQMRFHSEVGKKVYDKDYEFKDFIHANNYISNRAIEKVSPLIAEELAANREMLQNLMKASVGVGNMFESFTKNFLPTFEAHAENIKTHTAVMKGIEEGLESNRILYTHERPNNPKNFIPNPQSSSSGSSCIFDGGKVGESTLTSQPSNECVLCCKPSTRLMQSKLYCDACYGAYKKNKYLSR